MVTNNGYELVMTRSGAGSPLIMRWMVSRSRGVAFAALKVRAEGGQMVRAPGSRGKTMRRAWRHASLSCDACDSVHSLSCVSCDGALAGVTMCAPRGLQLP